MYVCMYVCLPSDVMNFSVKSVYRVWLLRFKKYHPRPEAAGIRGSIFISAQLQAEKLKYQLEKEEQDEQVTSFFLFVCNKVW